ncbi:hypothetical protein CASFOL_027823 [Castilleja foliolosa]|uniref:F-box associated domain-containing protein n=1 Tax=Castilleja foliolosa TaxID=1961234 RepID=A0ABD3CH07_9LAMI
MMKRVMILKYSWKKIDPGFQFSELWFYWIDKRDTVNGNPYWFGGRVDGKDILIGFDMSKLVLKIVPLSTLDDYDDKAKPFVPRPHVEFVDFNGSLGAIVFPWRNAYFDVWVFVDVEQVWTKNHSVGPIEVKLNRVLRCLKDGRVLGMRPTGYLIVFNSKTKCVKGLFNFGYDFEMYDYTTSLVYIQGMEKVRLRKRHSSWSYSYIQ